MLPARTIWTRPASGLSADRDIAGGGPTHLGAPSSEAVILDIPF